MAGDLPPHLLESYQIAANSSLVFPLSRTPGGDDLSESLLCEWPAVASCGSTEEVHLGTAANERILQLRVGGSWGTEVPLQLPPQELPTPHVEWCPMPGQPGSKVLCVLQERLLSLHYSDGRHRSISLPYAAPTFWVTPCGILITAVGGQGPLMLPHPLDPPCELFPVASLPDTFGSDEIVWSSPDCPLVATNKLGTVALWRLSVIKNAPSLGPASTAKTQQTAHTPRTRLSKDPLTPRSHQRLLRNPDGGWSPVAFQPTAASAAAAPALAAAAQASLRPKFVFERVFRKVGMFPAAPSPASPKERTTFLPGSSTSSAHKLEVHVAHDKDALPLVCFFSPEHLLLTAVKCDAGFGSPRAAFTVANAFTSVTAVLASRREQGLRDLLVVHVDRGLRLYEGSQCIQRFTVTRAVNGLPYATLLDDKTPLDGYIDPREAVTSLMSADDIAEVQVKGSRVKFVRKAAAGGATPFTSSFKFRPPSPVVELAFDPVGRLSRICNDLPRVLLWSQFASRRDSAAVLCGDADLEFDVMVDVTNYNDLDKDEDEEMEMEEKETWTAWEALVRGKHHRLREKHFEWAPGVGGKGRGYNDDLGEVMKVAREEMNQSPIFRRHTYPDAELELSRGARWAGLPPPAAVETFMQLEGELRKAGAAADGGSRAQLTWQAASILSDAAVDRVDPAGVDQAIERGSEEVAECLRAMASSRADPAAASAALRQFAAACVALEDVEAPVAPLQPARSVPALFAEVKKQLYMAEALRQSPYAQASALRQRLAEKKDGRAPKQREAQHTLQAAAALEEAQYLLHSNEPRPLKFPNNMPPRSSEEVQAALLVAANRALALPWGRGALELGTYQPLPTEALHPPQLCFASRVVERNNAVVQLDVGTVPGVSDLADFTAWPEFHNGVAAGLRYAAKGQLARTWTAYSKPPAPSNTHAGLLLGLGLQGHLACLAMTDIYRYMSVEHDATLIGLLLGISAAKRRSMDQSVSKLLGLHLPNSHAVSQLELEISPLVQTAALLGLGLVYQGSCQRSVIDVLVQEIGRRPGSSRSSERTGVEMNGPLYHGVTKDCEGYALSAGIALGLVVLGKGGGAVGPSEMPLQSKLKHFLQGGLHSPAPEPRSCLQPTNDDGFRLQIEVHREWPAHGQRRPTSAVEQEAAAMQGVAEVVAEGETMNLSVTGPASAFALGLMYLQSNNAIVAEQLLRPAQGGGALDLSNENPDHVALKTLMRALILWDSVDPPEAWVWGLLPPGTEDKLMKRAARSGASEVQTLAQAQCFCIAGACLALGIKYAGTCNAAVAAAVRRFTKYFLKLKSRVAARSGTTSGGLNEEILESCLDSTALALGTVMAGSCDLGTLRLFRALLKRLPVRPVGEVAHVIYGSYATIGLAIGFLCLGSGELTFGRTQDAVAFLAISLYPHLPMTSADNRHYLQALRHFYVVATEKKKCDDAGSSK